MVIDKPNQKILDITNFHGSKNMVLENYINYLKNLNSQTTLDFLGHKLLSSYINKLLDYKKTSNTTTTEFKSLSIQDHINLYIEDGKSSMDAIKIVSKERGMKKSEVYDIYHNIEKKW